MSDDPKDFLDRNADVDSRVAEIRNTDFAVLYEPEDPQIYWAFLLWELERVGHEPRRNEPQFGLNPEEYQHVFGRNSVDVVLSQDANARGSAYILRNLFKPDSWARICRAMLVDPNTKGLHVTESNFTVPPFTVAERVVETLLENDEVDPKEFAYRPDVQFNHLVWDVPIPDVRAWLRERGYSVLSARRRKRGSIALIAKRVNPPGEDSRSTRVWVSYEETDRLAYDLHAFLEKKMTPPGQSPNETFKLLVRVWGWPAGNANSDRIDIDIIKANETTDQADPYA